MIAYTLVVFCLLGSIVVGSNYTFDDVVYPIAVSFYVGMVLMMVKSGFGITILSDLAPMDHMTGLVTVPLVNAPVFCSGLFWRKDRVDLGTIPTLKESR